MSALEFDDSSSYFEKGESFLQNNRYQVLSGLVGLIFVTGGIFLFGSNFFEQPKVEVLGETSTSSSASPSESQIIVEISGYVVSPGVYKLAKESRIEDLLVAAGGLNAQADKAYVEKNINRAGRLVDGQKIYIPKLGESAISTTSTGGTKTSEEIGTVTEKININLASLKELDSLSGIGSTRAQAIIDNRPFSTIDDLVLRKVIPQSVFNKIKDKIVAQ